MKIAILHPAFFEGNNGAERFAYEMGKHLRAEIYTSRYSPEMERFFPGIGKMVHPLKMRFPDSLTIAPWEYSIRAALRRDVDGDFLLFMSNFSIFRHSFDDRPYLYMCHTPERGLYDLRAQLQKTISGWPLPSRISARTSLALRGRLDHYYFTKVVDPQHVVTNSRTVYERYRRVYGVSPRGVVLAPVDVSRFRNRPSEDFLFTAGGLRPNKRVDWQIRAAARTGERLVVAGDGPARASLERLSKKLKANVDFTGRIDDRELVELYSRCRAFVFTAKREDLGMAPIEALASGKPVISIAEGGPLEYLDDSNSFLFRGEKGLERAIRFATPGRCSSMRGDCTRSARRYHSPVVAKRILKHIKALSD